MGKKVRRLLGVALKNESFSLATPGPWRGHQRGSEAWSADRPIPEGSLPVVLDVLEEDECWRATDDKPPERDVE